MEIGVDVAMEVTEFERGVEPPDGTFTFTPPEGAEKIDPEAMGMLPGGASSGN
jgi:outer membrane lipoprotein-sorting protein